MSLKIILGLKSKHKSEYFYNMVHDDVCKNNNVILFVPSQKRVVIENEYMDFLGLDGIINLNITTIGEYIKGILKISNMHIDEKYLSDIDKRIIVLKLINENKELLKKYKKAANKEGFVLEIIKYIEILRGFNIRNSNEIERFRNFKIENKNTKEKFLEILFIYEKYLEYIKANGFLDDTSYINIYSDNYSENVENKKIYFEGYNNFKKVELDIIEMYLKNGYDVTISITTDAKSLEDVNLLNTSDIFEISNATYKDLIKIASKNGIEVFEEYIDYIEDKPLDLQRLSTYTFNDYEENLSNVEGKNIEINLVKNEKSEIESIANKILNTSDDVNFKDNVIFTTNLEEYENVVKQVFSEYNIPFYIDKKIAMQQNLLIKYILNFLDIINNKNNALSIIKTLKIGLNDFLDSDIYLLENYFLEFNILNLNNEFLYNSKIDYDLDKLNSLRKQLLEIFSLDKEKNSVDYYIKKLYDNLTKNNVFENYIKYINSIENDDERNVLSEAIKKLNEIVDSISKIYKNDEMSFKEFSDVLKLSITKTELNKVPLIGNEVLVLDINSSKTSYKKNVYIVGANEEEFPKIPNEDIIFNDIELEEISENGVKLKENVNSKLNMALFNIYEVFTLPQEKTFIYYKSSNMNSKTLNKSNIVENLKDLFRIEIHGSVTKEEESNILNYENLLKKLNVENLDEDSIAIFEYLNDKEVIKDVISWEKSDKNLKKETLDLIYKDKVLSSITKLEAFKKCPFSYYLKYVVNLNKRQTYEVSNMDLGSLMHGVIEDFSYFIMKKNLSFREIANDEKFETLEPDIEKMIDERIDKIIPKQKQSVKFNILREKLVLTLKAVIKVIAISFAKSEFTPFLYEAEFKEGAMFAPIELVLKDGKKVELIGKIDRVDTLKFNNKMYVRVVDYKSSNRELSLEDIKEGISLQLLTYMAAFIENMKENKENLEVIPAAMNYFTLSSNMLSLDQNMTDEELKEKIIEKLRLKGIFLRDVEILNKMDNEFENKNRLIDVSKVSLSKEKSNKLLYEDEYKELLDSANTILKQIAEEIISGVVKIAPNKKCDACKYCDYSSICRKNIRV